jgi:hypothetical protein
MLVTAALLVVPEARAEDQGRRWYGLQTLAVYGVAAVVTPVVISGVKSSTGRAVASSLLLGVTLLGGPAVHTAHNRWHAAEESLGLNVGLSALGGLLGDSMCYRGGWHRPIELVCIALGAELGWIAAVSIDVATLTYEDVPVATVATQRGLARRGRQLVPPVQFGFRF